MFDEQRIYVRVAAASLGWGVFQRNTFQVLQQRCSMREAPQIISRRAAI
jgi:hypothetical protein